MARSSSFVRDAVLMVILNGVAKLLMFASSVYAARCLGPVNLGVSAQILSIGQQASIVYNGGFDPIATREIAANNTRAAQLTKAIILFRLALAILLLGAWTLAVCLIFDASPMRNAWLLGGLLMFVGSLNLGFLFQGLEKLPIQGLAGVGTAILTACGVFLYFHPNMIVGADIAVALVATFIPLVGLWAYYRHLRLGGGGQMNFSEVLVEWKWMLKRSWYYWVLALVVYLYSGVQIPIVTYFLGEESAGIYRSAVVLANGLQLLYGSIAGLLLPRLVTWNKDGLRAMWDKQKNLAMVFVCIGLPVTGIAFVAAPTLYEHFLGPQFNGGALIFQILAVQTLVVFIGQIYAWGLTANEKHGALLSSCIFGALVCIGANPIVAPAFGIAGVAVVSLVAEVTIHTLFFLVARRHFRQFGQA